MKVLIANRGEIACRIQRTCAKMGIATVSIYTEVDSSSSHVVAADESRPIADYLDGETIIQICKDTGATVIIPGYGFLSENEAFATKVREAGLGFAGPESRSIRDFGMKHTARTLAGQAGVPIVPGTGLLEDLEDAKREADRIGYPVMLKASAGGGGMGLVVCHDSDALEKGFESTKARSESLFKDSSVYLEKYFVESRHVEVQVFGNGLGDAIDFGERECSIQRRHQKIIEECPSPFVESHPGLRDRMCGSAVHLAKENKYKSAGTIEYIVDDTTGDFYFLEMNTRLQVEHGITELVYQVDLVELMLRQCQAEIEGKEGLSSKELASYRKQPTGAAIEARLYAENPAQNFSPSPGLLQQVMFPEGPGIRVDSWVVTGTNVSPRYDPLLAKIMGFGTTRKEATSTILVALTGSLVQGPPTNLDFLIKVVGTEAFAKGDTTTRFLTSRFKYEFGCMKIIKGGSYTSVQDLPARNAVSFGIPESGPMDPLSHRIANVIVGNVPEKETLEMTFSGPTIEFTCAAVIAITGAAMDVSIRGEQVPMWSRKVVQTGDILVIGKLTGAGCRSYLAVRGGFPEVAVYLGSKSTAPGLAIGGYQGRTLLPGDIIKLADQSAQWAGEASSITVPDLYLPVFQKEWDLYVMSGPHDSDDFLTPEDREKLYTTPWTISHNAARGGIRLLGERMAFARESGGEGGSHPSNVLEYGYPIGGLNWTGDDPVFFPLDAPDYGGFLSSTTVARGNFWKLGQAAPGDKLHLKVISFDDAVKCRLNANEQVAAIASFLKKPQSKQGWQTFVPNQRKITNSMAILQQISRNEDRRAPKVVYRQGGDEYILVEYGEMTVDIFLRLRVKALEESIRDTKTKGLVSLMPCPRSLLIKFDPEVTSQKALLSHLLDIETRLEIKPVTKVREFHLPVCFDDAASKAAIEKYMAQTRPIAAYLPDNVDFIRRSNGLTTRKEAMAALTASAHIVMAVGFLVGTPIFTAVNPLKRLVVPKYNPSRTFTPSGTVGIGGSFGAIYPCDAPGGYQFWGRTLPCFDWYGMKPGFSSSKPWIFENFDTIQFYEVSESEYLEKLALFNAGRYVFDIRDGEVDASHYARFERDNAEEIKEFKRRKAICTAQETSAEKALLSKWQEEQKARAAEESERAADMAHDQDALTVTADMSANIWKINVAVGDLLSKQQEVVILEAMKMEIPIVLPEELAGCKVVSVARKAGSAVSAGDVILVLKRE